MGLLAVLQSQAGGVMPVSSAAQALPTATSSVAGAVWNGTGVIVNVIERMKQ